MARPRLTPEEKEARRKERNRHTFSDAAYQHYDSRKEGHGSAEEWIRTAEAGVGAHGVFHRVPGADTHLDADMVLLGLPGAPGSLSVLKTAFRATMMKAHPDHGGTNEKARAVLDAFKRLANQFK